MINRNKSYLKFLEKQAWLESIYGNYILYPKLSHYLKSNELECRCVIERIKNTGGLTTYPGAFINWVNTAHYEDRAIIYKGPMLSHAI